MRTVEPTTEPSVAVIEEVPVLTAVVSPAALMVATEGASEDHGTGEVRSWGGWSEKGAMEVNGGAGPWARLGVWGRAGGERGAEGRGGGRREGAGAQ